jgi:hypothetical protein
MYDVRRIDPMRVSGNEHHGSTLLAETAEVSQDFFYNFSAIDVTALTRRVRRLQPDTSNAEDVLRSGLFE